jgi:hypothetical protein
MAQYRYEARNLSPRPRKILILFESCENNDSLEKPAKGSSTINSKM